MNLTQLSSPLAKKHLSFTALRRFLSGIFENIPDPRQSGKTAYSIHDVMMSGFACMYFQSSSLLQFQRQMEKETQLSNLQTIFSVHSIPSDTQLRDIIDSVDSDLLRPFFKETISRLQRGKQLEDYQLFPGQYLCALDATQYFSSTQIDCPDCLERHHDKGGIRHSHQVLQTAIMHPNKKQVLPLMPEPIDNRDRGNKQDCEINASKRLIKKLKTDYPRLGLILCGDGLYSKQPMIESTLAAGMHYIFVAKEKDHTYLTEWLAGFEALSEYQYTDGKGVTHSYEWKNAAPLHGGEDAPEVNYFRYRMIKKGADGTEKVTYKNSWVTDFAVTQDNIEKLVRGGRCRWKIENECFNTLKNQGYHIEHNYGHGKKNLCFNFYLLTLAAFSIHQVQELTDKLFQACRRVEGSKQAMWGYLRTIIDIFIFSTFEQLMDFVLDRDKYYALLKLPPS